MQTISERIDNITKIPPNYQTETPPCPRSVKIELTGRCNFACRFCARGDKLRQQSDMGWAFFTRVVMEMREAGVEELGLFYLGESFMVPWLEDAIHFAKREAMYPYVFLTTNGSLSTPRRIEACARSGLDSLKFSLNWADEDQFAEIAGVKKALFAKTLSNVQSAWEIRDKVKRETGHHMGLYGSYIQYDGEQGERMQEFLSQVEPHLDEVYALPLYNQADLVTEKEKALGWTATAGNRGRLDNLREPLPCWALFTEGHISWDGKLVGCCFAHTPAFDFGDLNKTSFMDAWHSGTAKALRAANLAKDVRGTACEGCVAYA